MRLIIAGSRDLDDRTVAPFIDAYVKAQGSYPAVILSGVQRRDAIGEWWASHYGTPVERYPADWDKHGKAAGPVRNARWSPTLTRCWSSTEGLARFRRRPQTGGSGRARDCGRGACQTGRTEARRAGRLWE